MTKTLSKKKRVKMPPNHHRSPIAASAFCNANKCEPKKIVEQKEC